MSRQLPLHGLAYESRAFRRPDSRQLQRLLEDARSFNLQVGVTGVLLHHGGRFFQYLEGAADSVHAAYARILGSSMHHSIQVLFEGEVPARHFDAWHMGFCEPPQAQYQAIANAEWSAAIPLTRSDMRRDPGIALVVRYWNTWVAERLVEC